MKFSLLPIIAVSGPTAVGKTEASVALAEQVSAEIVSCDSMQIYEGVEIGTAKPSSDQMKEVPHHLIGVLPQETVFNASEFVRMSADCIQGIRKRGKNVVLTGGTGLYLTSLFEGIFEGPGKDAGLREELERKICEHGVTCLYRELEQKDPEYAKTISERDERRIIRALEVIQKTGEKFSFLQKNKKPLVNEPYRIFCLEMQRQLLYRRINERVDRMMKQGLLEEAKDLFQKKLPKRASLLQAIGYKEIFQHLEGTITLEESVVLIKRNTRRFAKRQFTWFKKMENVTWINADKASEDIAEEILKKVESRKP